MWGNSSIPNDVTRLTLMIASKDLMHSAVRSATGKGLNDFNPALIDVDNDWIIETKNAYKNIKIDQI